MSSLYSLINVWCALLASLQQQPIFNLLFLLEGIMTTNEAWPPPSHRPLSQIIPMPPQGVFQTDRWSWFESQANSFSPWRFFQAPGQSLLLGEQDCRWPSADWWQTTLKQQGNQVMPCRINLVHLKHAQLRAHDSNTCPKSQYCDYLVFMAHILPAGLFLSLSFLSFLFHNNLQVSL